MTRAFKSTQLQKKARIHWFLIVYLLFPLKSDYPMLSNVKGITLYKRKHAKEITLTGFHSPFNGQVIYAVMCMTVTCGILLLVMLKLRISRISSQTRNPPPIQIPEGVIIH